MTSWTTDRRGGKKRPTGGRAPAVDWPETLLKTDDAALAGVIFVVPLILGGRHDVGRLAFGVLSGTAGIAWFARQYVLGRATRLPVAVTAIIGAGAMLLVAQLIPMPANWIAWLSPRTAAVLPLWAGSDAPGTLGAWSTITIDPEATRLSLAMFAAYALFFVTVLQRIETSADAARLMQWIGLSAGLMAIIGLVQFAVPNGKFLWVYEHPSRDAGARLGGAFANRNHFAHFLALGAPALAAWFMLHLQSTPSAPGSAGGFFAPQSIRSRKPDAMRETPGQSPGLITWFIAALLILTCAAAILSCSRGGAVALATSAVVITPILWRAGLLTGGRLTLAIGGALAVFLTIAAVGYDQVAERLGTLASESLDEMDAGYGRRRIWEANLAAIRDGGLLGAGAGTHPTIYPLYTADPPGKHYTHAESGYLQIATENGIAGGVVLAGVLVLAAIACWRVLRRDLNASEFVIAGAGVAALAASVIHSVFDFVWYIPACLATTLVALACVWRATSFPATAIPLATPAPIRSRTALPWAIAASLAAAFAVGQLLPPAQAAGRWDAYLRIARAHRELEARALATDATKPADAADHRAEMQQANLAAYESMIRELSSVVHRRPAFALAHAMLADRCVQLFNLRMDMSANRMPVSQIRDCAVQQKFTSAAALREWLARATSGNHELLFDAWSHAQQAAALSPLEGDAYVRLGELCFLEGRGFTEADAYLQQALLVRPHDGGLLFEVGTQWGARGIDQWMWPTWQHAFTVPGPHRLHIARAVGGRIPVEQILASFAPEWDTLPVIWRACQTSNPTGGSPKVSPDDAAAFLPYAQQQAAREAATARPAKAVYLWRSLAEMQREAGQIESAIASLIEACRTSPDDYTSRKLLGLSLCEMGRFSEGEPQLKWCLGRKPDDSIVAITLMQIDRGRLARNTYSNEAEVAR